jgi:hypothetical protein
MRPVLALLLLSVLVACHPLPGPAAGASAARADSIVLERSYCIVGMCPAYRVSVARTGVVHFRPANFGDTARVLSDAVPAGAFEMLVGDARRIGFAELPERIGDSPLCGRLETDWPMVYVTLFAEAGSKRILDPLGCRGAPAGLRRLEMRIDSVASVRRWMPAKR